MKSYTVKLSDSTRITITRSNVGVYVNHEKRNDPNDCKAWKTVLDYILLPDQVGAFSYGLEFLAEEVQA